MLFLLAIADFTHPPLKNRSSIGMIGYYDPVVYHAEFGVEFLAGGPRTASIKEGLDCLGLHHSGLEEERDFRLVVELPYVPPDAHSAYASPPGSFNGHIRGFGYGAP